MSTPTTDPIALLPFILLITLPTLIISFKKPKDSVDTLISTLSTAIKDAGVALDLDTSTPTKLGTGELSGNVKTHHEVIPAVAMPPMVELVPGYSCVIL